MKKLGCLVILLLLFCCGTYAAVLQDSHGNIYCLKNNILSKSDDQGVTWNYINLPTSEVSLSVNSDGNIYAFYIKDNQLFFSKTNNGSLYFEDFRSVYSFEDTQESCSIGFGNNIIYLYYLIKNDIYCAYSPDSGRSFTPPQILNNNLPAKQFATSKKGDCLAFLSGNKIYYMSLARNWSNPQEIHQTDNMIDDLKIQKDSVFWIENLNDEKYLLSNWSEGTSKILCENAFPIKNLKIDIAEAVTFSIFKGDYYVPHYILKNIQFGLPRPIKEHIYTGENFEGIFNLDNSIYALWSADSQLKLIKVMNSQPNPPQAILSGKYAKDKLKVSLKADDPDLDPLTYKLEVSWDKDFGKENCWVFNVFSKEAEIPLTLSDDRYYLRAYANDLISYSLPSDIVAFIIDRQPPKFIITKPEKGSIVNDPILEIKGMISEEAKITINSSPVIISNNNFSKTITLKPGENQINILATDEAGNSTSESFSVIFNEEAIIFTLLNPKNTEWYKKGSTILVEALVQDKKNSIEDEAEASIKIDDKITGQNIYYSKDDKKISGFITLPDTLSHGDHRFQITLNSGVCQTTLKIDASSPEAVPSSAAIYQDRIIIPITEKGGGIDLAGSAFLVKCGSVEVLGKLKTEGLDLVFYPYKPLELGSYEVNIKPRDLVGNIGQECAFTLNFDKVSSYAAAQVSSSSVKILSLENGPNPFSPSTGQTTIIKYQLSRMADIKFYIFTLDGQKIFSRSILSTDAGKIIWDGRNVFGDIVSSGVYIYVLSAQDNSGNCEAKQGKIIAFQ